MNKEIKEFREFSRDLYNGTVAEFSVQEANDKLRKLIKKMCGGEYSLHAFLDNKYKIFAVMSELLTVTTSELSRDVFEPIAEFKDTAFGDRVEFEVENPELFEVSVIASGTNDLLRQKLMNGKVKTDSFNMGVKIYNEFTEFMTGRIDWDKLIEKVAKSFNHKVTEVIGKEWSKAYSTIDSKFKATGTFDADKFVELAQKIASYSPNGTVKVYGSKTALSKIKGREYLADDAKERKEKGYISLFEGIECVELVNSWDKDTDTWALDNDTLFILPDGQKPLLIGFEGDAIVLDEVEGKRKDMQLEYFMSRMVHLGVLKSAIYGIYKYN
ncbi:hypothetical protein [Fusobacterium sp.]|uniref:hypothetical protein n=1 Tax=Fusobacterium sp. TaxID=68766 RepID=UPI002634317E|nr:hypothetical protein [Fusobacterium sp.]